MANDSTGQTRRPDVEFFFDVMCPYAFRSAQWIVEVQRQNQIEIGWRFFSLEEVNRPADRPHPWEREWPWGWSMLRVAALLRRQSEQACGAFYLAAGTALHLEARKPQDRPVLEAILDELGHDPALATAALADPSVDEEIRVDHDRAIANGAFGVPTLHFADVQRPAGHWFFGPVVVPAPTGEAALRLWDLVNGWVEFPHLYEIQRPKAPADLVHIAAEFSPYLQARDWESVQNPTP
jgi:2-hydroxychromene-2-carboxylate isomerase